MTSSGILGMHDHSARSKSLYIDGLDVLLEPGSTSTQRYGVPIDTILLKWAGPGGISELSFDIDDPGKELTLREGQIVRYWNHVSDRPLFLGFLDVFAPSPAFGPGRAWHVECVGIEIMLDWLTVPAIDLDYFDGGLDYLGAGVQKLYAESLGVPGSIPLNTAAYSVNGVSNPFTPVQRGPFPGIAPPLIHINAGTLRAAINQVPSFLDFAVPALTPLWRATVDFLGNLRWYEVSPPFPPTLPDWQTNLGDDRTLTISDTVGGLVAADLEHTFASGHVPHQVTCNYSGGTVTVTDGSGIPGPTAVIDDQTITNALIARVTAINYLNDQGSSDVRGSFRLEAYTDPSVKFPTAGGQIEPDSQLTITDAGVGLDYAGNPALANWLIASIEKRWNPSGTEEWKVSYGGDEPSAVRQLRRYTRATLS